MSTPPPNAVSTDPPSTDVKAADVMTTEEEAAGSASAGPAPANRLESVAAYQSADEAIQFGDQTVEASTPFVGQWRTLVSTTNWEKGRIICQWRSLLEKADAPITDYSDQAWAQLVGGVTSQHVGRLRRVSERFGDVQTEYEGLFWSHFQTACEWDDAEMWLEGALQNGWSISQMRAHRWETVGDGQPPEPATDQASELSDVGDYGDEGVAGELGTAAGESAAVRDARGETHDDSDEENRSPATANRRDDADADAATLADAPQADAVRPFENLAELPEDLAEAFEQFKLAILTHKLTGWEEVSRSDVLGVLESLKQLALAPSEES